MHVHKEPPSGSDAKIWHSIYALCVFFLQACLRSTHTCSAVQMRSLTTCLLHQSRWLRGLFKWACHQNLIPPAVPKGIPARQKTSNSNHGAPLITHQNISTFFWRKLYSDKARRTNWVFERVTPNLLSFFYLFISCCLGYVIGSSPWIPL